VDVVAVLDPGIAHEFENLEELLEVMVLLGANDVEHFVEVIGIGSVDGGSNVSGQIERSSVTLHNECSFQFELLQQREEKKRFQKEFQKKKVNTSKLMILPPFSSLVRSRFSSK
jgi:hypothetical protein